MIARRQSNPRPISAQRYARLLAKALPAFGAKGITSEVLRKRAISKTHAKKLARFLNVSVELFI